MTMNAMELDGYTAVIRYKPETDEFRGEIQGLSGGADFHVKASAAATADGVSLNALIERAILHELHAG